MKKNIENSAIATSSPVTLMPVIERTRKMPGNGTSGALVRSSISTKAASSTSASPTSASVSKEPQPAWLAFTSE